VLKLLWDDPYPSGYALASVGKILAT